MILVSYDERILCKNVFKQLIGLPMVVITHSTQNKHFAIEFMLLSKGKGPAICVTQVHFAVKKTDGSNRT